MKEKTVSIRIRQSTKKRLDNVAEYMNLKLIDVIDRAIGVYMLKLIETNLDIAEKRTEAIPEAKGEK